MKNRELVTKAPNHIRRYKEIQLVSTELLKTYRSNKVIEFINNNYFIGEDLFWKIIGMNLNDIDFITEDSSCIYKSIFDKKRRKIAI